MTSKDEMHAIVRNYPADCQPTRTQPLGPAGGMSGAQFWRMATPRGMLVLRQWPAEHPTPEQLRFIHDVLFHAASRGVSFLALPIRPMASVSFVCHAGHLWELTPWMSGAADYELSPTKEKLRAAMTALAVFHKALNDFPIAAAQRVAGAPAIARHLGRLNELANGKVRELIQAVDNKIWPELVSWAHHFLGVLPRCLQLAIGQLEPLANVSLNVQPCLRDIWHDHVLFTGNEVTGIIDYGGIDIDTPATDIARLLGSLAGDDAAGWREGLAAYSTMRPLTGNEEWAARALNTSGPVIAGCNWLRWIYVERRQFENHEQIVERFRQVVARCEFAANS